MVAENTLKNEFDFYLKNRKSFVSKYNGKYIVIKGEEVVGVYDTKFEAYEQGQKVHPLGTFLIQLVSKEDDSVTQTFHSRVLI